MNLLQPSIIAKHFLKDALEVYQQRSDLDLAYKKIASEILQSCDIWPANEEQNNVAIVALNDLEKMLVYQSFYSEWLRLKSIIVND